MLHYSLRNPNKIFCGHDLIAQLITKRTTLGRTVPMFMQRGEWGGEGGVDCGVSMWRRSSFKRTVSRLICGRPQSSGPQTPGRVSVRLQWSDGQPSGRAKILMMVRRVITWVYMGKAGCVATRTAHIPLTSVRSRRYEALLWATSIILYYYFR